MAAKLLTVKETAERLGEHEVTTRQRLRRGELRGTKLSDGPRASWRVTESALNHFITKRTR